VRINNKHFFFSSSFLCSCSWPLLHVTVPHVLTFRPTWSQ
jgi:hypothetical protein